MKIFNCILGIFSLFAAFYCFIHPGIFFVTNASWIVAMLLCVVGFCSIFEYARKKENKEYIFTGVMGLLFGIAAVVFSLLLMFNITSRALTDLLILLLFAIWLIYIGIENISKAFKAKKEKAKSWWWSLILGILCIFAGIFSGTHLYFTAVEIGIFMGVAFAMYGAKLIGSVFEKND